MPTVKPLTEAELAPLLARNKGLTQPGTVEDDVRFITCDVCGRLLLLVHFRSVKTRRDVCNVCRAAVDASADKTIEGLVVSKSRHPCKRTFDFSDDPLYCMGRVKPIDAACLAPGVDVLDLSTGERVPDAIGTQMRRLECGTAITLTSKPRSQTPARRTGSSARATPASRRSASQRRSVTTKKREETSSSDSTSSSDDSESDSDAEVIAKKTPRAKAAKVSATPPRKAAARAATPRGTREKTGAQVEVDSQHTPRAQVLSSGSAKRAQSAKTIGTADALLSQDKTAIIDFAAFDAAPPSPVTPSAASVIVLAASGQSTSKAEVQQSPGTKRKRASEIIVPTTQPRTEVPAEVEGRPADAAPANAAPPTGETPEPTQSLPIVKTQVAAPIASAPPPPTRPTKKGTEEQDDALPKKARRSEEEGHSDAQLAPPSQAAEASQQQLATTPTRAALQAANASQVPANVSPSQQPPKSPPKPRSLPPNPALPLSPPEVDYDGIMSFFARFQRKQASATNTVDIEALPPLTLEFSTHAEGRQSLVLDPPSAHTIRRDLKNEVTVHALVAETVQVLAAELVPTDSAQGTWLSLLTVDGMQCRMMLFSAPSATDSFSFRYAVAMGPIRAVSLSWLPLPLGRVDPKVLGFVSVLRQNMIVHAVPLVESSFDLTLLGLAGITSLQGSIDPSTAPPEPVSLQWITDGLGLTTTRLLLLYKCGRLIVFSPMEEQLGQPSAGSRPFQLTERNRIRPAHDMVLPSILTAPPMAVTVEPLLRVAIASGSTLRVFSSDDLTPHFQHDFRDNITAVAWHSQSLVVALSDCTIYALKLCGPDRQISSSLNSPVTFLSSFGPKTLIAGTHSGRLLFVEARVAGTDFHGIVHVLRPELPAEDEIGKLGSNRVAATPGAASRSLSIISDFNVGRPVDTAPIPPRYAPLNAVNGGLPLRGGDDAANPLAVWFSDGVVTTTFITQGPPSRK